MSHRKESGSRETRPSRRRFLKRASSVAGAVSLASMVPNPLRSAVYAAGSDAPEKAEVRIGLIPLTDCASIVIASAMGFDRKYGITIVPSKEASWASVRDKLVTGALDASHALYGMVYGVHLGIGGPRKDMAVLMGLSHNGQAITLSSRLHAKGVRDGASLKALMDSESREYTFAQTFPTGTHAMWLYYWLAANGINPMTDAKAIVVPPPQMVASMRNGNMDGFCAGEPWNTRAIADGVGFTAETTQAIWKDHPEKVLGASAEFVNRYPNTARAMTAAILDAGRWIDASPANRRKTAEIISGKAYVNTDRHVIEARMLGRYDDGIGGKWEDPDAMKFHNGGYVNFPFLSDGMWFMTQHRRWGLLKHDVDYATVAREVNRIDLYIQAAVMAKVDVPSGPMRASTLIDGVRWDPANPAAYAASFSIRAA